MVAGAGSHQQPSSRWEQCWHRVWSELRRRLTAAFRAVSSQDVVGGSEFSFAAKSGNSAFKSTTGTSPEWYWLLFPFFLFSLSLLQHFPQSKKTEKVSGRVKNHVDVALRNMG